MRAYCYATGQIEFGRTVPRGALPIASGHERKLRPIIEAIARHGWKEGVLLVPGIPETAPDQIKGLEALERFITQVAKRCEPADRIMVSVRGHRWPIEGKRGRR